MTFLMFFGSTGDLLGWFLCNRLSFWQGSRTVLGTFSSAVFKWSETARNYQNRHITVTGGVGGVDPNLNIKMLLRFRGGRGVKKANHKIPYGFGIKFHLQRPRNGSGTIRLGRWATETDSRKEPGPSGRDSGPKTAVQRPKTTETDRSRPGYIGKLPINRPWRPTSMCGQT